MKQALLGLALTALSSGSMMASSQITLASSLKSSQLIEVVQPPTGANSSSDGLTMRMDQQPVLVSVASNWTSKLPAVRNRIIGELEGHLKRLAQGNQGSAKVEALRVEGRNLYVKILIHHKHEPKRRFGIPQGIPYSLQTWVETRYNPLDNKSIEDRTNLCVRGPSVIGSPNLCVTAGEVRRIISAFL
jgi:hypothetical protein